MDITEYRYIYKTFRYDIKKKKNVIYLLVFEVSHIYECCYWPDMH